MDATRISGTWRLAKGAFACVLAWCLIGAGEAARAGAHVSQSAAPEEQPTPGAVLEKSRPEEWRTPRPENLVLFELNGGKFLLELVPAFAPRHLERIRQLVRQGAFDDGRVVRSQDNYVAQWSTRSSEGGAEPIKLPGPVAAEFERPAAGIPFVSTGSPDPYAPEAGFAIGQAVARAPADDAMWMVHCYGVVGVARGEEPDSGNGTQLYAVTGHAPRHLDRNMTVVGRVIDGMEQLSTLARGTGPLGFYESDGEQVRIRTAAVVSDLPAEERPKIELLRTNSASFAALVSARKARSERFFVHQADGVDVCNVPIPSREPADPGGG